MRALSQRSRPSPLTVDRLLAVVLTIVCVLEIWLTPSAEGHRLVLSIAGPVTTGSVALRRRYPATVGIAMLVLWVVLQTLWPSQVLGAGIAWMCDAYGFAAWAQSRRFALGVLWHPEAGEDGALFRSLVDEAAAYATARTRDAAA